MPFQTGFLLTAFAATILSGQTANLTGHTREVNAVSCSGDGKFIASGGEDATLVLWDAASHSKLASVQGDAATSLAFSPDGKRIASGERYKKIKLFDGSGKELKALEGHGAAVVALGFSADSKTLYSFASDGGIRAWDAASGTAQGAPLKITDMYSSAAFSNDGKFAVAGTLGGNLYYYDLSTRKVVFKNQMRIAVRAVAISPAGNVLALAMGDESIRFIDASTGNELGKATGVEANGLAFSADGERVAAAGHDGDVYVIAVQTKTVLSRLKGHQRTVRSVCFAPDGRSVVSGSFDKTVRIWPIT